jgi:uncharacterized protein with NRDE domain
MCIALLAVEAHPRYPLVVLANRDELFARATQSMHRWEGSPTVIAGRDLQGGGTWLGANDLGQCALLTNFREPPEGSRSRPSRGELVAGYLQGTRPELSHHLREHGHDYAGFNIIFGPWRRLVHFSNRGGSFTPLTPGLHGLSNALLDTPWPKVTRGKALLARALAKDELEAEPLFAILADSAPAGHAELPDTGLAPELERRLSSIRILAQGGSYGSRCATVMLLDSDGRMRLWERAYGGGPTLDFELFQQPEAPPAARQGG